MRRLMSEFKKVTRWMVGFFCFITIVSIFSCGSSSDGGLAPSDIIDPEQNSDLTKVVIGRGYDVTSRYAFSPDIRATVLDHDKLDNDGKIMEDNNLAEAQFYIISGNTISEYQNSLAVSASVAGSIGIPGVSFSSEIGAHFDRSKCETNEYAFATSTSKITKIAYFIEGKNNPTQLLNYLSDEFQSDLQTKSGEALIEKYGTHVMLGGVWGARLDYHLTARKKTLAVGTQIGTYVKNRAEATFDAVTVTAETYAAVDNEFNNYFEVGELIVSTNAYGGSPEYAQSVQNKGDYDAWIASIADNPVWCDYYPESLCPIYEFISAPDKKEEIKKAYADYLKSKVIVVADTLKTKNIYGTFVRQGFTEHTGGGDGDINSKDNRNTEYEFTITIIKDEINRNLKAEIYLRAEEKLSNYTKLEGRLTGVNAITIPVNENIISIDLPSTYTLTGTITGQNHDWIPIGESCPFLSDIEIVIDGSGDDMDDVGIKGNFNIPISYR